MLTSSRKYSGFDPRTVGGCVLWLDAADTNTVTTSAGSVTAWADKSGSGYSATASAGRNPTYTSNVQRGNSAITCTSSQSLTVSNFAIGQTLSAFVVYCPINQANAFFMEHSIDTNSNNGFALTSTSNANFSFRYSGATASISVANYTNSNVWQLIEGINPDPNFSNYLGLLVNGVRQGLTSTGAMVSNTSVTSNLYLNGRANGSTLCYANYIGEIIIYNVGLPSKERQAVEGYLAWKWGIQTTSNAFTPTSISGCHLWLDATDASSVTLSGSNVTAWRDKSASNQTITVSATQPTRVANAIGTLPAMYFAGGASGPYFRSTFGSTVSISNHTLFLVVKNAVNTYQQTFALGTPGSSPYNNTSSYRIATWSNGADAYANSAGYSIASISNTPYSPYPDAAVVCHYVSNGTGNLSLNGYDPVTYSTYSNFNYSPTTVAGMEMGFLTASGGGFNGYIGETILYNVALTASQRQQVTKYLYTKWNVPSVYQLSAAHPNTVTPTISRSFQPTDICGCSLWLDAADAASVTTSGSNVITWIDKSGNTKHASNLTLARCPTYDSGQSVVFTKASNQYLQLPNATLPASTSVGHSFFIVATPKSAGTDMYVRQDTESFLYLQSNSPAGQNSFFTYVAATTSTVGYGLGVVDTRVLIERIMTPTTIGSYSNGSNVSNASMGSTTFTGTNTELGGGLASGLPASALFHEVLLYNATLTAAQRQQIEAYLVTKWGLRGSLVSTNPFKSLPALMPSFDPRQYGCFQWYDSADPASLILSNSNVIAWNDKSGNMYNLSNLGAGFAQSAVEPTTGQRTAYFSTSNIILQSGSMNFTSNMYFFVALKLTEPSTTTFNDLFAWNTLGSANNGNTAFRYYQQKPLDGTSPGNAADAGLTLVVNGTPQTGGAPYSNYAAATYLAPHLVSFQFRYTTTSTFRISDDAYSRYFIGYLYEVIVLSNAPAPDIRQRIEGYLTQKWGRVSDLSGSHPYRKLTP